MFAGGPKNYSYATDHTVPAAVQPLAFLHLARFVISCLGLIQSELDRLDWIRSKLARKNDIDHQLRSVYLDVASSNVEINRPELVAELR